ncbi:Chromo domain-containing protein LHP1 [Abeliophyllum distichum]|uniref:Chromo domain-containing protein LHP1 n=1 Tax=Abeliophyllum distichum TaxID=126358 RepID=A0ABD1TG96_9LAMI
MKGGKKKPSTESVQPPLPPPFNNTAIVNGDDDVAGAEENREETERFEATEETLEEDDYGDEDEDSETEKDYDHFENLQIEEPEAGAEAERSKLADGYYEIEAVRRKRVRKGQVQYLIKWRGWPEAENTWEPLENLLQCSDVIDAFEESLITGKSRSARGRKRKHGITHAQMKKKQQQRLPVAATNNVPSHRVGIVDDPMKYPQLNNLNVTNGKGKTDVSGINGFEGCKKVNEHGVKMVSATREKSNEQNELDLKLCELKESIMVSEENANKFGVHSQEGLVTGGDVLAIGLPKSDCVDPVQSGRCTGAKKRKSFPVKRFKQDSALCIRDDIQNAISAGAMAEQKDFQTHDFMGNDRDCKNKFDNSKEMCNVTQIVKPISYSTSTSNSGEEVSLTFEALRSDGTKVMVDNKFLKANNPILLINFYEKHLRYSPT